MNIHKKSSWLIYLSICSGVALAVLSLLLNNRDLLRSLLTTGGILESFPALIYVVTAVLSIFLMVKTKKFFLWGLYSVFCLFLTGEEASWGGESVFGWQLRNDFEGDFHNLIASFFAQNKSLTNIYGIIIAIAVLTVGFAILNKKVDFRWLKQPKSRELSWQFKIAGLCLLLFGGVDYLQEGFGLPYPPGNWSLVQWAFEECSELFASIAFLFAALTHGMTRESKELKNNKHFSSDTPLIKR